MRVRGVVVVLLWLAATACAANPEPTAQVKGDGPSNVPVEFREACGKPGATVTTARDHVVIRRADCDLTGVVIGTKSFGGAAVPESGGVFGCGDGPEVSECASVHVDDAGTVTFSTRAEPGTEPITDADLYKAPVGGSDDDRYGGAASDPPQP